MNSSIFNFKMGTLYAALATAFCLVVLYSCFLKLPAFLYGGGVGTSDLQNCLIRAERYSFDLKEPIVVFLGTSKTARIRADLMGLRYYNLAYPCLGISGGLFYIEQRSQKPKVVLLEVNQFANPENYLAAGPDVRHESMPMNLRKAVKVLRQEYSLFLIFKYLVKHGMSAADPEDQWFLPARIDLKSGEPYYSKAKIASLDQEADILDAKLRVMFNVKRSEEIDSFVKQTNDIVRRTYCSDAYIESLAHQYLGFVGQLAKGNSKVVLHEVPETNDVQDSSCRLKIRRKLKEALPGAPYFNSESHVYATSDGLHLSPEEAIHYSSVLRRKIEQAGL